MIGTIFIGAGIFLMFFINVDLLNIFDGVLLVLLVKKSVRKKQI
jgi:hypothetical protein